MYHYIICFSSGVLVACACFRLYFRRRTPPILVGMIYQSSRARQVMARLKQICGDILQDLEINELAYLIEEQVCLRIEAGFEGYVSARFLFYVERLSMYDDILVQLDEVVNSEAAFIIKKVYGSDLKRAKSLSSDLFDIFRIAKENTGHSSHLNGYE